MFFLLRCEHIVIGLCASVCFCVKQYSKAVILLLLIALIVFFFFIVYCCSDCLWGLCVCPYFTIQYFMPILVCNYLDKDEIAGCFNSIVFLMSGLVCIV